MGAAISLIAHIAVPLGGGALMSVVTKDEIKGWCVSFHGGRRRGGKRMGSSTVASREGRSWGVCVCTRTPPRERAAPSGGRNLFHALDRDGWMEGEGEEREEKTTPRERPPPT